MLFYFAWLPLAFFYFYFFLSYCTSLSLSLSLSSYLWSSLSQLQSLIVNVAATEAWRYRLTSRPKPWINLKHTPPSALDPRCWLKCLLVDIGYLTGKPMELADPPLLFFILFVIDDFVWSRLRKKIGDLGFFFFFLPAMDCWWWLWWWWC